MAENLNTNCFMNGESIPSTSTSNIPFSINSTYQWYRTVIRNNVINYAKNNRYYTAYTFEDSRGLVSEGWKIPDLSDWDRLKAFSNGNSPIDVSAIKLKGKYWRRTTGITHTNELGFDGNAFGYITNMLDGVEDSGIWWASTKNSASTTEYYVGMNSENNFFSTSNKIAKTAGLSIRCVKE